MLTEQLVSTVPLNQPKRSMDCYEEQVQEEARSFWQHRVEFNLKVSQHQNRKIYKQINTVVAVTSYCTIGYGRGSMSTTP